MNVFPVRLRRSAALLALLLFVAPSVSLAQSPLSQHLSKLRGMKLVAARRDGQQVLYRLASDEVVRVLTTLHGIYCADSAIEGMTDARANA